MAKRQDSGSNAAHQNQRPTSHNEDALPEETDNIQGRMDKDDDEFEETDDSEELGDEDDADEGSY